MDNYKFIFTGYLVGLGLEIKLIGKGMEIHRSFSRRLKEKRRKDKD